DFSEKYPGIKFYNRKKMNRAQLLRLVEDIDPQLIYCSGWIDKDYIEVCKRYKGKIPVVGGIDTAWSGSIKQRVHVAMSAFTTRKYYTHVWIAGEAQYRYAKKLGFNDQHILHGVYSADTSYFLPFYEKLKNGRAVSFPKKFIYVGRYLPFKGVVEMWEAFAELADAENSDWELWCLGTGDLWEKRMEHPTIKHFGFVQPSEMEKFLSETGVFILPSQFEPWAVVVHEFCAAGFPLICSNKVGAATLFLEEGSNGYTFEAGNKAALKNVMKKMMNLSQQELMEMSCKSHEMAKKHSPEKWAAALMNVLNHKN
ncbi:MAG: glycosyltransferase family 4 protein, partial [Flavobacteriales bacterium]